MGLPENQSTKEKLHLADIGYGTQRTSGTYIALLLALEDRSDIPFIINDVLDHFQITPEKLIEFREWDKAAADAPMPKI